MGNERNKAGFPQIKNGEDVMLPSAYRSYEVFMDKQEVEADTHSDQICVWSVQIIPGQFFSRAVSGRAGQETSAHCFSGFSCSFVYSS